MDQINPDVVQLWFHYEEIAMHFNELIIQYRLQLMGGAGVIGVLSGYLVGEKVTDISLQHKLRAFISTGILILILAAAYLDVFYYNQLLRGAVDAIIKFENEYPYLYMSTSIKSKFCDSGTLCDYSNATLRIIIAYCIVIVPILGFTVWSWMTYKYDKNK